MERTIECTTNLPSMTQCVLAWRKMANLHVVQKLRSNAADKILMFGDMMLMRDLGVALVSVC